MGEEEHIAAACASAADDTVRTRADGIERLAAGAAVAEKAPAGALHLDIDSASTFVRAVIPFHQIVVNLYAGVRHRKLGGATRTPQRTRDNMIEAQWDESCPELARLAFALIAEWKIGTTGMLRRRGPRSFAVAHEVDHWQCASHFVALSESGYVIARAAPGRRFSSIRNAKAITATNPTTQGQGEVEATSGTVILPQSAKAMIMGFKRGYRAT